MGQEISWTTTLSTGRRLRLPEAVAAALRAKEGDKLRFITTEGSAKVVVVKMGGA